MKRPLFVLLALLAFTGCGRGTSDIYRAYNLPQRDSSGKVVQDLAAQNRYTLQTGGEYKYFYTAPEPETASPDGKTIVKEEVAEEQVAEEQVAEETTEESSEETTEENEEYSEEVSDTEDMDPTAALSDKLDALSEAISGLAR